MSDIQIIHKNSKPYGIRNTSGFLLFFPEIHKYEGQEKRYSEEVLNRFKLAKYLSRAIEDMEKINNE